MSLSAYARVLRERWFLLALFILVSTGAAVVITQLTPKVYQASAQVLVVSSTPADASIQNQANAVVTVQVPTFAKVIGSPEVIKYVNQDLHLALSSRDLTNKLTASSTAGEAIIDVGAMDGSPKRATDLANSAARGLVKAVEGYTSSVKLFVTGPAEQPSSPASPTPVLNILLGALLGLLIGAVAAVARDLLDNRIKDADGFGKLADAPVMGAIVDDPTTKRYPVASSAGQNNVRAENFRQLRANLQFANVDEHPRVIAVTSSIAGEGKTTVAINLASTLADAGFTVCLVDTDLRRPTAAEALGLLSTVGLTTVLIQQIALADALQDAGAGLYLLAAGPIPPNPSEVLASSAVREVIRSLLDKLDYVVLDTAPLLPVADGCEVAALADGTLLVARHSLTTTTNVERAIRALRRVDSTLLGVVLNRTPRGRGNRGYDYAYYHEDAGRGARAGNSGRRGRRRAADADRARGGPDAGATLVNDRRRNSAATEDAGTARGTTKGINT
ncbi:MAG: polysaccharide biosynthesis tyrosine autokinase [Jatrophihabitans sp.]